jgi:hypothetical protein
VSDVQSCCCCTLRRLGALSFCVRPIRDSSPRFHPLLLVLLYAISRLHACLDTHMKPLGDHVDPSLSGMLSPSTKLFSARRCGPFLKRPGLSSYPHSPLLSTFIPPDGIVSTSQLAGSLFKAHTEWAGRCGCGRSSGHRHAVDALQEGSDRQHGHSCERGC